MSTLLSGSSDQAVNTRSSTAAFSSTFMPERNFKPVT